MSIHLRRGRLLFRNDKNHSNKYIIVFYAHKQVNKAMKIKFLIALAVMMIYSALQASAQDDAPPPRDEDAVITVLTNPPNCDVFSWR